MTETANIEIRLMNLEQCVGKQNVDISQRIARLEVKINILTYVAGAVLVSILGMIAGFAMHL